MKSPRTERETFIRKLRRETRWLTPIMLVSSAIFTSAIFWEGAMLSRVGAGILAVASLEAVVVGVRMQRADDNALLRSTTNPQWGVLILIGLGVALFAAHGSGSWAIAVAVVIATIPEAKMRAAHAQSFLNTPCERMSVAH